MLELETQLAAIALQAKELVQAMEAIRNGAIKVKNEETSPQPVERMLIHMIAEEEESMREIARHLAALHYMVSSHAKWKWNIIFTKSYALLSVLYLINVDILCWLIRCIAAITAVGIVDVEATSTDRPCDLNQMKLNDFTLMEMQKKTILAA